MRHYLTNFKPCERSTWFSSVILPSVRRVPPSKPLRSHISRSGDVTTPRLYPFFLTSLRWHSPMFCPTFTSIYIYTFIQTTYSTRCCTLRSNSSAQILDSVIRRKSLRRNDKATRSSRNGEKNVGINYGFWKISLQQMRFAYQARLDFASCYGASRSAYLYFHYDESLAHSSEKNGRKMLTKKDRSIIPWVSSAEVLSQLTLTTIQHLYPGSCFSLLKMVYSRSDSKRKNNRTFLFLFGITM